MKRFAFLFFVVLALFVFTGCSQDKPTQPDSSTTADQTSAITVNPEALAATLVDLAGWPTESSSGEGSTDGGPDLAGTNDLIVASDREVLIDDIVHYSFVVQVGSGQYDVIRIHRIVQERRPNCPIKSRRNVFLLHGDLVGFEGVYLFGARSASTADDYSSAVYLAQNGVDVWGMDQNWALLPESVTDFSVMADWGLQNQVDNLGVGLATARFARLATGNGFGKMHLGAYSSGAWTGYAYLNQETQLPPGHRHVKGFIPIDGLFKTDNETDRLGYCETGDYYQWLVDTGVYADDFGTIFVLMSDLARTDPDGPSPVFPGFTNMEAAWGLGSYPAPPPDFYHFIAGQFDDDGMPTGLTATRTDAWLDFMANGSPYEATRFIADYYSVTCDVTDVPWDDHLGEIVVPILLLAPAGGMGHTDYYTTTLLGSTDITIVEARLTPPVDLELEFGHIDIFTADIAPNVGKDLLWTPMLDWILAHSPQGPPLDVVHGHE